MGDRKPALPQKVIAQITPAVFRPPEAQVKAAKIIARDILGNSPGRRRAPAVYLAIGIAKRGKETKCEYGEAAIRWAIYDLATAGFLAVHLSKAPKPEDLDSRIIVAVHGPGDLAGFEIESIGNPWDWWQGGDTDRQDAEADRLESSTVSGKDQDESPAVQSLADRMTVESKPMLQVTATPPQAIVNGLAYALKPPAVTLLTAIIDAGGEWINGGEEVNQASRVVAKMPVPVRLLIEAEPGKGFRLRKPTT